MTLATNDLDCDVLVIGGGINGAGIARDAAGRGLSVVLCEKDDLASHTSSASSKLIHGGLRYLEYYEFNLVRKALIEREVLMRSAPHIISPLRFVMPHLPELRPAWMLRAGLFLYDHLAHRDLLPGSFGIKLRQHPAGQALHPQLTRGFEYSDGWVDDARLVVLAARDAAEKGATILTRTICIGAQRNDDHWLAQLQEANGHTIKVRARSVINATGAWASALQHQLTPHDQEAKSLRLVKGSHIVVKRLFDHPYAYIFQNGDGRIVFALPYEDEFTLIGTTDLDYHGDMNHVHISEDEVAYLCELSNQYFTRPIQPSDVLWSFSGVRPLVDDGHAEAKAITRDYRFELNSDQAPLLTIYGGKITTFRKLAEQAVDQIAPLLGNRHHPWTADACLPGGDVVCELPSNRSVLEFDQFIRHLQQQYPWLPAALVKRYAKAYGTRIHVLLHGCHQLADMGDAIAPQLYPAEVHYLMQYEWANTADDILWRRSKLGLHLPPETAEKLAAWMAAN